MIRHLPELMRIRQWHKNFLIFAALVFSLKLTSLELLLRSTAAFVVFCLLSSSGYIINDIRDRKADRQHPVKRSRPIASGRIRPGSAAVAAGVLSIIGITSACLLGMKFALIAIVYLGLLLTYSLLFKHIVIMDVLTLSLGFVLRAQAGAVVIAVPFSPWLMICTLLGALFLSLAKRRNELVILQRVGADNHRKILAEYSLHLLDQMISVVTASMLLSYALYTLDAKTRSTVGENLFLTVPFVLYGIFRYLYLVHMRKEGGDPSQLLIKDRAMLINIALWGMAVLFILYGLK